MATPVSLVLPEIEGLSLRPGAPLSEYTRFGIGGPADLLIESSDEAAFTTALAWLRGQNAPYVVIGAGTNLVVADEGFRGIVLRYTAAAMRRDGLFVDCDAGAELMELVRFTIGEDLEGIQTLMGIPGSVGAAIYGNAGAYGHSISEVTRELRFFDGSVVRTLRGEECEFRYRESVFKREKSWILLRARMEFRKGDGATLRKTATEILAVRNEKFPPAMKCAGSIFNNLHSADLPGDVLAKVPETVIREGKIPAAWFLEQVGAKDSWEGRIHIAPYHANLIYNAGGATAVDLRRMIARLKQAVRERFGIVLEEEVQYVGFPVKSMVP
ncbi:MAG: UDP-N-acetylmuramate dehydrogenase [Bryobacterales bacterium]|nr:UDP-N-acetylmuramate dehydrogenase [Bryobacterales bacterium]